MNVIWGNSGGMGLFDYYSLQHIVWFIAITLLCYLFF